MEDGNWITPQTTHAPGVLGPPPPKPVAEIKATQAGWGSLCQLGAPVVCFMSNLMIILNGIRLCYGNREEPDEELSPHLLQNEFKPPSGDAGEDAAWGFVQAELCPFASPALWPFFLGALTPSHSMQAVFGLNTAALQENSTYVPIGVMDQMVLQQHSFSTL